MTSDASRTIATAAGGIGSWLEDSFVRLNPALDRWEFFDASQPTCTPAEAEAVEPVEPAHMLAKELPLEFAAAATRSPDHPRRRKRHQGRGRGARKQQLAAEKKSVQWGDVIEITFVRAIGFVAVPNDGVYPLGLGDMVEQSRYPIGAHETQHEPPPPPPITPKGTHSRAKSSKQAPAPCRPPAPALCSACPHEPR